MKIAFSTLGCPDWSWDEILATAKDLGFDGVELRGIENEIYVPKAKPFNAANIKATIERLNKLKLEIPCITSSCFLFDKENIDFYLNEGKDYIDLAEKLGVKYVRVLGDANPEPSDNIDDDFVAGNLSTLAEYASGKNVKVLIETNGVFADSNRTLELIRKVNSPGVGVLWDVHHPYRFMGETVEKTYYALREYIMFVHVKDSKVVDGKIKYKMMGYGDVPVKEALQLLKENDYKGFVSLEWVKRWCKDLEEPGVVFSHYINYVRRII
ncbi:MAG TPA: sugar phosphate isomerase/epimerase [Clostridiaceae bacterium]|nr:sugar phosphate isomerase/epimerase [Clostridiaceae bacterium]